MRLKREDLHRDGQKVIFPGSSVRVNVSRYSIRDLHACVGGIERRLVRRATSEPSTRGREGEQRRRGPVITSVLVTLRHRS